jgi:Zn-dependent peptidase ImmA (M78 family)
MIKETYYKEVESNISELLNGRSIDEWCDDISNEFIKLTRQESPPHKISLLLPHRKANFVFESKKININGKINPTENGFLITLNSNLKKSKSSLRFTLAHELAHTYFFNLNVFPPINISAIPSGSKYLEFMCDKIARHLLVPDKTLQLAVRKYPLPTSEDFSLLTVNHLSQLFEVPNNILLRRLIDDTGIWDCVFLTFRYFDNALIDNWKLVKVYKPRRLYDNLKYYLPRSNKTKEINDITKFPSAKGALFTFLCALEKELSVSKRKQLKINKEILKNPPLRTFIKNLDSEEITLYTSYDKSNKLIHICLPLSLS